MNEIWKCVKGYEGYYQVSNFGRVKSLDRTITNTKNIKRNMKGRILKTPLSVGYPCLNLSINGYTTFVQVHILVAIAFHNHIPCGHKFVINHIDFNPLNNKADNLEIVTQRENTNQKHLKSSSKYTGVSWIVSRNTWRSSISINGFNIHIGYFDDEYKAHLAYEKVLKEHNNASN